MNDRLNVSFKISRPTEVVARIYDTGGRLIKTLVSGSIAEVGENLLTWDGRKDDGGFANDGLYIIVIEAEDKKAQQTFVILNK